MKIKNKNYRPQSSIYELGEEFYDPVEAVDFPKTILRYRDDHAAASIGLDGLSDADWIRHFGRFEPLKDNIEQPLALRYHGHQFQHYNPDLGDGRGFLFAQMRDEEDRLLDLGTKGSGQTPWSRKGDGRLTLLGGIREVLATRYLQHLGVNTSRTFSLIETGEALQRNDEPSPTRSAVMVRLSHSHIRFGTFQRQAFFGKADNIKKLVDYCRRHYFPDTNNTTEFFEAVIRASADTVASWMVAGFVHGVMNTDNMNITGESFDYGPYRFLPTLKAGFTAAYFDHQGLYAFARQPEIMYWNLAQLAKCLALVEDDDNLIKALEGFADHYKSSLRDRFFEKLAVRKTNLDEDISFVLATFRWLEASQTPWPQFWHDWQSGAGEMTRALKSPNKAHYAGSEFDDWFKSFSKFKADGKPPNTVKPASLIYEEIGALWDRIDKDDDWSAFEAKLESFER